MESGIKEADSSLMSSMTRSMSDSQPIVQSGSSSDYSPSDLYSILGTGISLIKPINRGTITSRMSR